MRIKHDTSCIPRDQQELINRGYGYEDLHSLVFHFEYTKEERESNLAYASSHSKTEWENWCTNAVLERNFEMFRVIDALSKEFICYQYEEDCDISYHDEEWDYYFWCNTLFLTTKGRLDGRDYSYFRLTFNELHTAEMRADLCRRTLQFIEDRFADYTHLVVTVQYKATKSISKIEAAAKVVLPLLEGRRCQYLNFKDGRVVQTDKGAFFLKKGAKSRGYPLSSENILQIYWNL